MAYLTLSKSKLQHNFQFLNNVFRENNISWAIVSKLLCGNEAYLKEIINLGTKEICDSRISNLKKVKEINPDVETVYIKPPAKRSISKIIKYADASFNTEYETIKWLSEEAVKQNKQHKVIIMIELGDLREGVMGEELMDFYESVFKLPNIKVTGIGSNLNCLYGVMPSTDKLVQLSLYKQLIDTKFGVQIPWVTGGTSVVVPLLFKHQVPKGINHFRVGEILYFGNNLFTGEYVEGMNHDVFKLYAEIIEITEKPKVPIGVLEENPSGETFEINEEDYGQSSYRAIIDIGLLDIDPDYLIPENKELSISGASSDMLIIDLGETNRNMNIGDLVAFDLKYMGALSILNSDYIDKKVIE
ncbi:alanine racemase [Marinigracilibium pacificum]|uniref:Alanine/ornithine racemase family PLP-dependent enzyme n=1 Tax=Marinigracilibium pacificum TaxID=2729599 RepID=A0A848IXL0_9BACT|nr:alanine/ornithine racemase family PLP-dependent enzyme [Marinigracilibium pacificum]NMM46984.1 alanine/ornithine racemase family PLP-dependent enzyme [Marinigracilibium pacificum]